MRFQAVKVISPPGAKFYKLGPEPVLTRRMRKSKSELRVLPAKMLSFAGVEASFTGLPPLGSEAGVAVFMLVRGMANASFVGTGWSCDSASLLPFLLLMLAISLLANRTPSLLFVKRLASMRPSISLRNCSLRRSSADRTIVVEDDGVGAALPSRFILCNMPVVLFARSTSTASDTLLADDSSC